MGHALMDNRNDLMVNVCVTAASGTAAGEAALSLLDERVAPGETAVTLRADRGHDVRSVLNGCAARGVEAHVARKANST